MRKLFVVLAFAGLSMSAMAQNEDPTLKHSVATNSFWSNWFIQVGGNYNIWYSDQEHGRGLDKGGDYDFLSKDRRTFGAAVALGKWFTPGLGFRAKVQFWEAKRVGMGGTAQQGVSTFKRWNFNGQALFNVSNMLFGYNPNRVWNVIPFAGAGFSRNMDDNLYAMNLSVGLLSTWRLSKHVSLHAEAGWNRLEEDFDGQHGNLLAVSHHNRGWEDKDNNIYAELGLTFNLGKATWDKTPDVDAIKALSQAQIDALNAQLNDANAENARLRDMLAKQKPAETPKSVKEFIQTPISVFFNLDKTNIASQKDLVNVRALATYAKENNSKLMVKGYADSATGKADHNQWLSERRAETVANELVKMGVSRDNIRTQGFGGVDELSPISFNRRATVEITE